MATSLAPELRLGTAGEAEILAALRGKGRDNLPLLLPFPLAPPKFSLPPNFAPTAAVTQIWQRASPFGLRCRTRVLFSSRGGACAHLRRLSAVSFVRHDGDRERIANLNNIYNCNDVEAIQMLRMRRAPFYALVKTFRDRGLLTDSINTFVEEQVGMRSTETISWYFQQVLYALGELRGEMIKPASMNTPTKIKNSYRWFPYFRDCIGAIDGTHVTAKVSRSMSTSFRGRKHYTSQNVLATVDFEMRFTYVLAGWEGSAHDASILSDCLSRPDGLQIPDGKFYLGDAGYACRHEILPPFRKTRYRLNEFSAKHRPLNAREFAIRSSYG
nr:uncharacterized protein LOC127329477 [Lolium perenne]